MGFEAFQSLAAERALVAELTDSLKVPRDQLLQRIAQTTEELRNAQRKLSALAAAQLKSQIPQFLQGAKQVAAHKFVATQIAEVDSAEQVRDLALGLRAAMSHESAVVAVSAVIEGKVVLIVATTEMARASGISSGKLVKIASELLGGGGGGKDDIAQGGGVETEKIGLAITAIEQAISGL